MRLHKFKLYVKVTVRRLSNPVFFMLLGPIALSVVYHQAQLCLHDGHPDSGPHRQHALLGPVQRRRGRLSDSQAQDRAPRNGVDISSDNVAVTPSARQAGVYDIAPFTLQNIISSHISDLKILSVESPVEIEFPQQEHD